MRDLLKNKQKVYYSKYIGKEPILVNGLPSGSFRTVYSEPTLLEVNINHKGGSVEYQPYGSVEDYDMIIKTTNKYLEVDKNTRFWVDVKDITNNNFNFVVSAVGPSLNVLTIYLKKVSNDG